MHTPPLILIIEDEPPIRELMAERLADSGYAVVTAGDGQAGLEVAYEHHPDLILTDVNMPRMDGRQVVQRLRADADFPFTPIIMITALAETDDVVRGLEHGADEYLAKPVAYAAVEARVRSMLRIKSLHDTVQAQAAELAELNRSLEDKVQAQLAELQRLSRLRRFLAPQVAEDIVLSGEDNRLAHHRREVTVAFCDLRGYTAFTEASSPEEVMQVLGAFHQAMGEVVFEYEGTLERFTGDGMMVFFNDPRPAPDHTLRAARMAVTMQERLAGLKVAWDERGYRLDMGVGIAVGEATLGMLGLESRADYAAIGTVTNLAARLCGEAAGGEILVSPWVAEALEGQLPVESVGARSYKGFAEAIETWRLRWRE